MKKLYLTLFLLCSCIGGGPVELEKDYLLFDYKGGERVVKVFGTDYFIHELAESDNETDRDKLHEKVVNGESHYYNDWTAYIVSQDKTKIRVVVQANNTKEDRACFLKLQAGKKGSYFLQVEQFGNPNASAK